MDFNGNYEKLRVTEGRYSNDKTDRGGETYVGISRVNFPDWAGWSVIDEAKKNKNFPACLEKIVELQELVKAFYKHEFWDMIYGDSIPEILAEEMFDTGVNQGRGTAVKYLQHALNVLNRNQALYADMPMDGGFGVGTKAALEKYLQNDSAELLVKVMNVLQGYTYVCIMDKNPEQEKYARGWMQRVEIKKS